MGKPQYRRDKGSTQHQKPNSGLQVGICAILQAFAFGTRC